MKEAKEILINQRMKHLMLSKNTFSVEKCDFDQKLI